MQQKNLTNDRNIPGIKNLYLNHISIYLVKLMSSMYAFYFSKKSIIHYKPPKCKILVFKTTKLLFTFYSEN